MTSTTEVKNLLVSVLEQAAEELKLKKYSINLDINVGRGDGFLGELFKATIVDEETDNKHFLVMKKAPSSPNQRDLQQIEEVYKNEIFFYSKVLPTFQEFEEKYKVPNPFSVIPGYITSCKEIGKEVIVLRDITFQGFEPIARDSLLDDEHVRSVFKTYGHFHAISFCLKEKEPEVFKHLSENILVIFHKNFEKPLYRTFFEIVIKHCYDVLDPVEDAELKGKFKKYADRTIEMLLESFTYKGKYSGILHGDCWSNNIMFKYQDSKLTDINLLDFQAINIGTPIYDLAYFFYSGGSKELFDNLELYLDVYHESFSETARNLGCDPEKIFSRKVLSEEWKNNGRFGLIVSLFMTKIKLIDKEAVVQLIEAIAKGATNSSVIFEDATFNKDIFKKRVLDILLHSNEIGLL